MNINSSFIKLFIAAKFVAMKSTSSWNGFVSEELTFLLSISHLGLKKYVNQEWNETNTTAYGEKHILIDDIVNKIATNYPKSFETLSSYKTCTAEKIDNNQQNNTLIKNTNINGKSSNYYKSLLNQTHLVVNIFQYLDILSINNCSLVDSIWLMRAFHPKSARFLDFRGDLVHRLRNVNRIRTWQRFCAISKITVHDADIIDTPNKDCSNTFLNGLTMIHFGKAREINIWITHNDNTYNKQNLSSKAISSLRNELINVLCQKINHNGNVSKENVNYDSKMLNKLSFKCTNSTEQNAFDVNLQRLDTTMYQQVELMNSGDYVNVVISKNCEMLSIDGDCAINTSISDVSGVKSLTVFNASGLIIHKLNENKLYCPKINRLIIHDLTHDVIRYWSQHAQYLTDNNGKVSLSMAMGYNSELVEYRVDLVNRDRLLAHEVTLKMQSDECFRFWRKMFYAADNFRSGIETIRLSLHPKEDGIDYCQIKNFFMKNKSQLWCNLCGIEIITGNTNDRQTFTQAYDTLNIIAKQKNIPRTVSDHDAYHHDVETKHNLYFKIVFLDVNSPFHITRKFELIFDLIYNIVVVLQYPVHIYLGFAHQDEDIMKQVNDKYEQFYQKIRNGYVWHQNNSTYYDLLKQPKVTFCITPAGRRVLRVITAAKCQS